MTDTINVYCDESCHLENDHQKTMVLGALTCKKQLAKKYNDEIAQLKKKHQLSKYFEIKWHKVSQAKIDFYLDIINFFFDAEMSFRAWVVPDKAILTHAQYKQTHDEWYYKMYFYLLRNIINTDYNYHIYVDIKDTRSRDKIEKLNNILSNAKYDFHRNIIEKIQHTHSHDIGLLQLSDLLIGALSYYHRGLSANSAKNNLIELIKKRSGFSLNKNTLPSEKKFNICIWRPNEEGL